MNAGSADNASTGDAGADLLNPRQVRILKFAVVAMGVAILVGLTAVFVQIARLAYKGPTASAAMTTPTARSGNPAMDIAVHLPPGARTRGWQLQASRLAIEYEVPSEGAPGTVETLVAIVDIASGTVVARVHVDTRTAK